MVVVVVVVVVVLLNASTALPWSQKFIGLDYFNSSSSGCFVFPIPTNSKDGMRLSEKL